MGRACQKYLRLIFWNSNITHRIFFLSYLGIVIGIGIWNYRVLTVVFLTQIFGGFSIVEWRMLGFGPMESFLIVAFIENITLLIFVWILILAWEKWEGSSFGKWIAAKLESKERKFGKFFIFLKKIGALGVFVAAILPFCTTIAIVLVKILNKKYLIIVLIIANTLKIASFNWGFHFLFFK